MEWEETSCLEQSEDEHMTHTVADRLGFHSWKHDAGVILAGVLLTIALSIIATVSLYALSLASAVFGTVSNVTFRAVGGASVGWRLRVPTYVHVLTFCCTSLLILDFLPSFAFHRNVTLGGACEALVWCLPGVVGIFLGAWIRKRISKRSKNSE